MAQAVCSPFTRHCLDMQGYRALDDEAKAWYATALRFTPGVCTALVLIGLILGSPLWLLAVAIVAFLGFVFPNGHPIDLLYNFGVRHLFGAPALPPNPAPRRFACLVGAVFLTGSGLAFLQGLPVLAWLLGGFLAAAGLTVTLTDWCLASWMYGLLFGRPRAVQA